MSATTGVTAGFPASMAFQKSWRAYQSRVLESLDSYLEDRRLHLVAAPGSGKTVLGLEVIRRIGKPTLVLAPTLTIRDQWVDRLVDHFLPAGSTRPDWVSTDLRSPKLLTVSTYQALHSLCSGEDDSSSVETNEEENGTHADEQNGNGNDTVRPEFKLPHALAEAHVNTLVVDEAHHLRAEWWRTLMSVAEELDGPTIVALTATPPYDVSPFEWQRYESLCGPVDAEVSVPELVLKRDLCPHQDYVYLSAPSPQAQRTIEQFRNSVDTFVKHLRSNEPFAAAVLGHPWMRSPEAHAEDILENPDYLSSMVIFVKATGHDVPPTVLKTLGLPRKAIPELDLEWLEILLSNCLYRDADAYISCETVLKLVRQQLREIGAIERRKVKLRDPSDHSKLLTSSVTKLESIKEIVKLESDALGGGLRCVVLTDFIRKSELPKSPEERADFEDIGVVPIFETLRRAGLSNIKLGVLSGSLVIIPAASEALVRQAAVDLGIRPADVSISPVGFDQQYLSVELRGQYYQGIVRLMTSLFHQGGITVLIGTKALLGEGWDAPCINSLVLASFVGSYMLSNQMRGRSIRIDPRDSGKTANIWHLVCVEPGFLGPGQDYELLVRRFGAFAGISEIALRIENGSERLGLGKPPFDRKQIDKLNSQTRRRALDRANLHKRWQEILESGTIKEMTEGINATDEALPRPFVLSNTIAALLIQAWFTFLFFFLQIMHRGSGSDVLRFAVFAAAFSALLSLPLFLRALWRFIRHSTPERSIRQIGRAVLESLRFEGSLETDPKQFRIYADRNQDGVVSCWIGGGTRKEQSVYLRALREALAPIDNPRYFLSRKRLLWFLREDYFPVPEVLGRKKEYAVTFARNWKKYVGPIQLIYSRTTEGRKLLLRARTHSLAASFQKRSERISCWK